VGAGQSEGDIAQLAHTVLVVEAPGLGDDVQAIKAGILEIADVLVVNKADQPNADITVRALRGMLALSQPESGARPTPICETVATEGKGIAELAAAIDDHRSHLNASGGMIERTRARIRRQIETMLREQLYARFISRNGGHAELDAAVEAVMDRRVDPYSAVEEMIK